MLQNNFAFQLTEQSELKKENFIIVH